MVGAAIMTYAQPKPTIRIIILTACFMVCFSFHTDPLGAGIHLGTNYIGGVNWQIEAPSIAQRASAIKRVAMDRFNPMNITFPGKN